MKMNQKLYEKYRRGDSITDTELACLLAHFLALDEMLTVMGAEWHLARRFATTERHSLEGFRDSRARSGAYKPKFEGRTTLLPQGKGFFETENKAFEGGRIVTHEQHEAEVAEAVFQARVSIAERNPDVKAATAKVLGDVKAVLQQRWRGGLPGEVVEDIVSEVLDPAIERLVPAAVIA